MFGLTVRQLHQLHWILRKKSEIETVTASQLHQLQTKNLKMFNFRLDREATTPTTLNFIKEVRDRDRYHKSTKSTTGQEI